MSDEICVDDFMYTVSGTTFKSKYGNANAKFVFKGGTLSKRGSEFVLREELVKWLLPQLREGATLHKLVASLIIQGQHTGVFSVPTVLVEEPQRRIKPAPAVIKGNTGVRKVETATLAEKPKKTKKKTEPKEPGLADMFALLSGMNAAVQNLAGDVKSLSGRMDAVEEAATEPVGGPDF